jgi:hypothetical protein
MKKVFLIILLSVLVFVVTPAYGFGELTREEKVVAVNAGSMLVIAGWGVAFWDYGKIDRLIHDEKWFQGDTEKGGADKLGHFYTGYVAGRGLSSLYESWGYEHDKAALYGALSSFGIQGFMELGDAVSKYGFSYEDFIMNLVGSCAGYLFEMNPDIARKIDFRVEYIPRFNEADVVTDYENMRFLVAVKLDGFDAITNKYLKYLELHLGYYVDGYKEHGDERSRNIYAGVGINLSRIFTDLSHPKMAKVFNYYQVPYTYIKINKDLD